MTITGELCSFLCLVKSLIRLESNHNIIWTVTKTEMIFADKSCIVHKNNLDLSCDFIPFININVD